MVHSLTFDFLLMGCNSICDLVLSELALNLLGLNNFIYILNISTMSLII